MQAPLSYFEPTDDEGSHQRGRARLRWLLGGLLVVSTQLLLDHPVTLALVLASGLAALLAFEVVAWS